MDHQIHNEGNPNLGIGGTMQQLELASTTQRWVLSRESKVLNTKFSQKKFRQRDWDREGELFHYGGGSRSISRRGGGSATVGGPVGSPGLLCRYQYRPHFFTRLATVFC